MNDHPHPCWRRLLAAGLVLGMFAMNLSPCAADSGRGRHKQIYAVPTPGKVVIDGQLDDWDLSAQIEMFVVEPTRATMNAKFALMYDDQALYLSGNVRDPSPLMNRNNPAVNPGSGWNADSCQFRLVVDPAAQYPVMENVFMYRAGKTETRDDLLHMTLWYYTDSGEPALTIQKGMTYRPIRDGWPAGLVPAREYAAAYRPHADGRGYAFEYRIPFTLLGAARPLRGGDVVAGTVQFNWSTPDGISTAGGSAWSYDVMARPGFPFQSADVWGRVIFSETGNVAREKVLAGVPRDRPLPLEFTYKLPADGETTIQLERPDGTVVRILVPQQERLSGVNTERWDGLDDTGDLLPAGEYRWRGIRFAKPLRVEYRFSAHNSGQPPYPTDDGKGAWGGDHGTPQAVARAGDHLLMVWSGAEYGSGTILTDAEGRKQWGSHHNALHVVSGGRVFYTAGQHDAPAYKAVGIYDITNGRPANLANGVSAFPPPPGGDETNNIVTGLAWHNDRLYVSYRKRNLVAVYSTVDGALQTTWAIPAPGYLAVRPDGQLAVVSGETVLTVRDGQATPWLTTHLDQPQGIVVAADGTAYVANRGALQNVSVFSPTGQYLRSIGLPGGRPAVGTYDPRGMLAPGGIALDAKGRLWVAETLAAPKRISVWDVRSGDNLKEFFGASGYMAFGTIDPKRPNELLAEGVLWEIDWATGTTRPKSTVWRATKPTSAPMINYSEPKLVTANDGHQYYWGLYRSGMTVHSVLLRRDGDMFLPFLGLFFVRGGVDEPTGIAALDENPERFPRRYPNQPWHITPIYLWRDLNYDQLIEPDEITLLPPGEFPHYSYTQIAWVEPDLTLRFQTPHLWRPIGFDARGLPLYDPMQPARAAAFGTAGYVASFGDGTLTTLKWINVARGERGPSLVRWSADGQMLWNFPNLIHWQGAMSLPMVRAGRLWGMTGMMGIAGDFFAHQTYFGPNQIFRKDGMYVGAVLQDTRVGGRGAYEGMPEGQKGGFVKLNLGGKDRYFTIGAGGDVRVWEVLGLNGIEDLSGGVYIHTEEAVVRARAAQAEYAALLAGQDTVVRLVPGGRAALDTAPGSRRDVEGGRGFTVAGAYDADNLYLRFDVTTPYDLVNANADPQIIFRGGNLLDIQLLTPTAPAGMRLLVTRQNNQPLAVLFQPKVPGFTGAPVVLTSPTGKEEFDKIAVVDGVRLDHEKTPTGFSATVTLPHHLTGQIVQRGAQVKLDLGYIFGNKDGTRTAVRAYLFNNSFTANVVDDIPHESRLEPKEWGQAIVE